MNNVSVIIPSFNREYFLKEAIESVLSQKHIDFELIVVDDGSNDQTKQLLSSYNSSLIYIHQKNKGVSSARNAGIKQSQGKYIAFLDSDDLWLPGKLKAQTEWMNSNTDYAACQTEEMWIRNGKRVNPCKHHKKKSGYIFKDCLPLCIVSPSAVMIRRRIFDDVGLFDESMPVCEDYDLWIRIASNNLIGLIDTPYILKRGGHSDQLSKSIWGMDRFRVSSLVKALKIGKLNDIQRSEVLFVLKQKCKIYSKGCKKRGKNQEAQFYSKIPESFSV
ncbi:MAG: glycosyltransferase [Candidatus Theseobacter exili]|nr:glycosyltransferase [Candidatus Theseobacter exili]